MAQHPSAEFGLQLERTSPEWAKAQRGELYRSFAPELFAAREETAALCSKFNRLEKRTKRNVVGLWRELTRNPTPLPPQADNQEADDLLFAKDPWICAPVSMDYGFNVRIGPGTFINYNATFIDTCPITIGARVLFGPNVHIYSGSHPLDPAIRNGTEGPETGAPVTIEDDCWIAGNVTIFMGVTIGRGSTIGAGSVVTKSVPPFHLAAGVPAKIIKKIESKWEKEPPQSDDR